MTKILETHTMIRLAVCIVIGAAIWLVPAPENVDQAGWHVLAVFVATLVSFLIKPLAMGPMVLLAIVFLSATGTLRFADALYGFGDTVVWLVVAAFLIAGSVAKTGLGRRIALAMVAKLGHTTLGLGYSAAVAELILAPFVPSNTARGGGVMAPIMNSLAHALDSKPDDNPERAGSYLMLVGAHSNLVTAAMFLTGMAGNVLVSRAAKDIFEVDFGWGTWLLGSIVPGLVTLAVLPYFLHRLVNPTMRDGWAAQQKAKTELKSMGKLSQHELIMATVFALLLILWVSTPLHGLGTGVVALIGVSILILTGVQPWSETTGNSGAWDTLIWLGGLVSMAKALKDKGVIDWFANSVQVYVTGFDAVMVAVLLAVIYFYSMYAFSMLTGHIAAMAGAFFTIAIAAGSPPLLMIALFAYFSDLCGCTTNYSSGPVCIYYGLGYVKASHWYQTGFLVSLLHLGIWLSIGMGWWKILGWW